MQTTWNSSSSSTKIDRAPKQPRSSVSSIVSVAMSMTATCPFAPNPPSATYALPLCATMPSGVPPTSIVPVTVFVARSTTVTGDVPPKSCPVTYSLSWPTTVM